ncbi:MAG: hypothetical protein ACE5EV_06455, partial [Gaiellales bacterium]
MGKGRMAGGMGRRLWLLASAVLAALVLSGTATAGGDAGLLAPVDRDLVDAAASVRERAVGVLSFGDVTGLGVGRADDGSPVVKAYVEKLPAVGVPASVAGVPVEVVLTGRASAQTEPQARASRPVPIGVSVGHPQVSAGTIGARVVDSAGVYLLSNNHVLADENEAAFGDPIVQPGPTDGGVVPDDTVAALSAFVPIDFSGGANAVDAAIATTSGTLLSTSSPLDDGFGSPGGPSVPASVGMSVQKYGRTSGRTTGTVDAVSVTVTVCYLADILGCLKDALFVDQIAIKGDAGLFSLPGDSGTNDATRNPVGLLFAGAESAGDETTSYANPIDVVLSQFGVTLDPADDPPGPLPPPPPPEPPPAPPPPSPPPPPRAPEADPA